MNNMEQITLTNSNHKCSSYTHLYKSCIFKAARTSLTMLNANAKTMCFRACILLCWICLKEPFGKSATGSKTHFVKQNPYHVTKLQVTKWILLEICYFPLNHTKFWLKSSFRTVVRSKMEPDWKVACKHQPQPQSEKLCGSVVAASLT